MADSDQQQRPGASLNRQGSPQLTAYPPQQSNENVLLNHSLERDEHVDEDRPIQGDHALFSQQSDKNIRAGGLARTHKQFFNKTMKVSEINKMSSQEAADGVSVSVATMG